MQVCTLPLFDISPDQSGFGNLNKMQVPQLNFSFLKASKVGTVENSSNRDVLNSDKAIEELLDDQYIQKHLDKYDMEHKHDQTEDLNSLMRFIRNAAKNQPTGSDFEHDDNFLRSDKNVHDGDENIGGADLETE